MKKLLGILASMGLVLSWTTLVVACGEPVVVTIDLSKLKNDLGWFDIKPEQKDILQKFNEINKIELTLATDVDVEIINKNHLPVSAVIKANSESKKYIGSVDTTFNVKINLAKLNNDLGQFEPTPNSKPTSEQIFEKFKKVNKLEEILSNEDIKLENILNITNVKAKISASNNSQYFFGTVIVNFKSVIQPTIYFDNSTNTEITSYDPDLSSLEGVTKIIQFGYYESERRVFSLIKMPKTIETVPKELPKEITSLKEAFESVSNFNEDISSWDVSNITDMSGMFKKAKKFNNGGNSLEWGSKTRKVTNMAKMFSEAINFNQDISSWYVSNVTDMSRMFEDTFHFDRDLSKWYVSSVTDMSWMFKNTMNFNQDLSGWYVGNVKMMISMFEGAAKFNQYISKWDVQNVYSMNSMFENSKSFSQNLSEWNVKSVIDSRNFATNASPMFDEKGWPQFSE